MAGSAYGRGAEQVSLRLPDGMRERIKAAADANNRSMNAEIVATLEERYPEPEPDEYPIEVFFNRAIDALGQDTTPEKIAALSEALRDFASPDGELTQNKMDFALLRGMLTGSTGKDRDNPYDEGTELNAEWGRGFSLGREKQDRSSR